MNNKGFIYIIDAVLAICIILSSFFIFNLLIESSDYSYFSNDFKKSEDIMESLSNTVNFSDMSFLEKISNILSENNNSNKAINLVSNLSLNKFNELGLKDNYTFSELNVINKVILSKGDIKPYQNYTVAYRNFGNYTYKLLIFK